MEWTYCKIVDKNLIGRYKDMTETEIFVNGRWIFDKDSLINDRRVGYDEFEPEGSPYKIGNTEMLSNIEKITQEEAMQLIK